MSDAPRFKPMSDGGRAGRGGGPFGWYEFRARPEADGRPCIIVAEDGARVGTFRIDITDPPPAPPKAEAGGSPRPGRILGPGTWLYHAIQALTLGLIRHGLGCERRRAQMDAAGWRGLPGLWWRWATKKMKGLNDEQIRQ